MKINAKDVMELHAIYQTRMEYSKAYMDNVRENDEFAELSATKAEEMDAVIEEKIIELSERNEPIVVFFVNRIMQAIAHLSISRIFKVLEVCGVETYEN